MKVLNFLMFCVGTLHVVPAGADTSMDLAYLGQNRKTHSRQPALEIVNSCAEFDHEVPNGSGWHHSDCMTVWDIWFATGGRHNSETTLSLREMFTEMSTELRQRGSPCLVESKMYHTGAGSSAIQHLETWMFAEEMGCDWIQPGSRLNGNTTDGSSLYCHLMVSRDTMQLLKENKEWKSGDEQLARCKAINWSQFFHYNAHAVMNTFDGTTKTVEVQQDGHLESIQQAMNQYRLHGAENALPWDHLLIYLDGRSADTIFQVPGSWDNVKRNSTRRVMRKYREGFHEFPRPWNQLHNPSHVTDVRNSPAEDAQVSSAHVPVTSSEELPLEDADPLSPKKVCAFPTVSSDVTTSTGPRLGHNGCKDRNYPSVSAQACTLHGLCSTSSITVPVTALEPCRFNNEPTCMYSSSPQELNFAIHIRLGDRIPVIKGFESSYESYIEAFMDTVTAAVTRRGIGTPMFHIFSETSLPCPSVENGTFSEFPNWPVDTYQIEPCLHPVTPEDCPEKRAGARICSPKHSGIFRVSGKPMYLHVGFDVQNEITCMAKADGILMGCSAFGQTAGVLNEGLKFFSFQCGGRRTPRHNNMTPLLAIAERGDLWVPVAGSWRNPSILSQTILEAALDKYMKIKGVELTDG